MLANKSISAITIHQNDTLSLKYFAGFGAEQKMNTALNELLKQRKIESKDTLQLNIGLQLAQQATDSLKWSKKQIVGFKTEQSNYNVKYFEMLKSQKK